MIKGRNQHVIPCEQGWCVVDETNQMVIQHFDTQQEAMTYAREQADPNEGDVLVHTAADNPQSVTTVALPQEHFMPNRSTSGHAKPYDDNMPSPGEFTDLNATEPFDPLLGVDSNYFEI
jgi:hypothetical protein